MPTRLLAEAGHDITVFYANSNIAPASEYEHRLSELRKYAAAKGFPVVEGAYDPVAWEREVAPIGEALKQYSPAFGASFARERAIDAAQGEYPASGIVAQEPALAEIPPGAGLASTPNAPSKEPATVAELLDDERRKERCRACYRMRLEEAAAFASGNGFDALTTTLAVSPYQFTEVIQEELERAGAQAGIASLFQDFRPYYDEATRISRELGMYRQNYCGCRFSIREGEATRAFVKQQRKERKARERAERTLEEESLSRRKAEKQAYAEAQAKKRAILKSLRQKRDVQSE